MKINHKVFASVAFALCITLTGCFSENYEESHGHVNFSTQRPPVSVQMCANGGGHLKNGSAFKLFSFYVPSFTPMNASDCDDRSYLLALFYPTAESGRTFKTEAGSRQVYASLVPNNSADNSSGLVAYLSLPNDTSLIPALKMVAIGDWWYWEQVLKADVTNEISAAESPAGLSIPGSIPLHGAVEIKQGSWFHRNFFHADVDLTGDDGLKLEEEYTSYDYRRFMLFDSLLAYLFWRGG